MATGEPCRFHGTHGVLLYCKHPILDYTGFRNPALVPADFPSEIAS
jgi:hypothetical protein